MLPNKNASAAWTPSDSALGNPSHAQVEALLGEPDEPDWKDEEATERWLTPRMEAMLRAARR